MRVLCHVHSYAPNACSGADICMERINTFLAEKCEVRVITDRQNEPISYKNHTVESNQNRIAEKYEWADVIITNLVSRNQAVDLAARFHKPIFHVVHNKDIPYLAPVPNNYIIYNSYSLQESRPLNFPYIVVQPPTWPEDWQQAATGKYITLVNLTHNKGAQTFYNIALNMPELQFMGVYGGYGQQLRPEMVQPVATRHNITYGQHTHDMQRIYDETLVLVVPSINETWSLCAAEAQACGIPVVCSDLPGLRENLGGSAIYANSLRGFMDGIKEALANYSFWSLSGLQRSKEKNHTLQLENLYNFMKEKVVKEPVREKVVKEPVREKKIIERPGTQIKTK